MKRFNRVKLLPALAVVAVAAALHPGSLLACAACGGASDSPLARGMNFGIFSLMGVVGVVLSSIATFFVFIAKKSASIAAEPPAAPTSEPTPKA